LVQSQNCHLDVSDKARAPSLVDTDVLKISVLTDMQERRNLTRHWGWTLWGTNIGLSKARIWRGLQKQTKFPMKWPQFQQLWCIFIIT